MTSFYGIKIGRNDPCLCGSGKKYKKCCLNEEDLLHLDIDELDTNFEVSDTDKKQSTNRLLKRAKETLGYEI